MRSARRLMPALTAALLAATVAEPGLGQVERVEMDIAGYLCGF
ncbi:MAG TPA: hypothetical protein VLL48_02340 [Longimicrobiales bacterium]|nr:hypothetical protein [Longimicrobiales bacterium]